jgi:hypothetical protein
MGNLSLSNSFRTISKRCGEKPKTNSELTGKNTFETHYLNEKKSLGRLVFFV